MKLIQALVRLGKLDTLEKLSHRAPLRLLRNVLSSALTMQWQFFFGACLLAGAALLPHAPARPVLAGMALAGVIHYAWLRLATRRNGGK